MEFEYWWLLALPLFFALGWMAARVDINQLLSESRRVPSSYFKGLNFLLNEQPDKAIEAFIEVVKVDPETIELHFALGSLFRRRGEVERAIRMHQNLVERKDLPREFREDALYELAQDYFKAGLLDRAEELLHQLEGTRHEQAALKQLLEIYETEKDWDKAIATSRRMDAITGQSSARDIANYYCEQAAAAMTHSRPKEARERLQEALQVNRKCVRANLLLGELEMQQGNPAGAIAAWKRIETQNPAYFALVAERLMEAYRQLGKPEEGLQLLRSYLALQPSVDLLDAVFRATLELQGNEPAYRLVREELRRHPTLLGLDRLLEAQLLETPPARRPDLELIKSLVQNHTRNLAMYRCSACGFRARQYYWRCPACGGWETYPPLRTEEKELIH
ncbi:lipopolysaccharide assembly protein LapB [Pelomicrobium sp.]|jgi:lipopolysaccharide biosynthesis regulator YciM|uniref:lipopolysaccharide assembly protein LapB n=1 Tax=Pelomicrobium sp. TaxID=2815319 RepID=UPI002FDF02E1